MTRTLLRYLRSSFNSVRAIAFSQTDQLPIRCRVREIDQYPLNDYTEASPEDILEAAYDLKKRKGKSEPIQYPEREDAENLSKSDTAAVSKGTELWTLMQFQELLYSRRVCVWDECNRRKKLN